MNNLYVRLAKNNLKNNKSLYVPYMVAGMITVLMFYIMMFINNSAGLEKMRGAYYITTIMSFGVIVVGVFSYIYIFYTNSFISKRRKKEMGIYNILGMEKRHIAKVLAIETMFTAFVSIVGGIVAGILFSKLALMLIYRILGIQVTIEFSVPPSAVKNTVLVFGILYMMTLFYNLMQMKLANPVELLRGSSVGEKEPKTKWLMAILGVVCLGAGYAIAITTEQPMKVISLFFVAVLLVIAGTYLLFTAGSIAVLKLLRKTHGFYYQKKHFIAVSTMMYRMKQNAAGLASICILSTMVMVMVSTTVCMFAGLDDEINILYPYEINVQTGYSEVKENISEQSSDIIQFIEDTGTNVTDSESYSYLNFAMTLEKDSLTIGQKPTNASLYFLTRDNFLRMDHTLTEADVPKVEAGKILIYRKNGSSLRKHCVEIRYRFLEKRLPYRKMDTVRIVAMEGLFRSWTGFIISLWIICRRCRSCRNWRSLRQIQRMSVRMPMKMYLESILPERRQKRSRAAETWRIIPLGKNMALSGGACAAGQ